MNQRITKPANIIFIRGRKSYYKNLMKDTSDRLFDNCWKSYLKLESNSGGCNSDFEVLSILNNEASKRVNNPRSSFWLHGE